ncbi:MAG: bi-domain-containing oxidoreductase [Anaerolineales bacterium]|jgi:predicted dehydrogenase/threonine dehydrogenase-like Zn-dependent dehydrogenase|nr:bi-domain-containing oxidoreductase [Anaerolineales bacterium]
MKQLLQNLKNGQTSIAEVPIPTPRAGQALVKVAASLVSAGTERMLVEFAEKSLLGKARSRPDLVRQVVDKMGREGVLPTLTAAFNRLDSPMPLGYSSAGTIVALGPGMDGFQVGQRVACAGGGYAVHAEYNLVPRNLLTPLPDSVDFESAAFTTLAAIALHGLRLAEPQLGENVAVIGLGLLGLLTIQLASAAGCRVWGLDTNPERVALASQFGISACSRQNGEESGAAFTLNRGFDSVIICADSASNDPVRLAGAIARDRAKIVATGAVGLNFPRKIYFEKELSFINSRSYGPGRYDPSYEENGRDYPIGYVRWTEGRNFEAVVGLLESGQLKAEPLISHRFPIEQAGEAYEIITGKKQEPFLGVLLTYPASGEAVSGEVVSSVRYPMSGKTPLTPDTLKPDTVKLGVLGAGLFANATLLPALKKVKEVELVGIASAGGLHAAHSAKKFGFRYACSDDEQIINDPQINTVLILTRHDSHADLVVRALQAGKHVFVEKPLAINRDQLSAIQDQLQITNNPFLTVGFNRRFAPLAQQLYDVLATRQEPLYIHYRVNAGYLPLKHWTHDPEQGGGRIIGEGCHFIDFLTFLAGSVPVSVSAAALPDGGKYREDNVSMTFSFADGSLGIVDYLANGDKSFPKERVEVFCGGLVAVLDDFRVLETVRDGKKKTVKLLGQDKGHFNEMQALVRAIRAGQAPIPYKQLIGVTQASFAAVESLRRNGEKVRL